MWISANLASGVSKKPASPSRLGAEGLRVPAVGTQGHAATPKLQPGVWACVGPPATPPLLPRQSNRAPSSSSIPGPRVSPRCGHALARCRGLIRWPETYSQPHRLKLAGAGQIPGLATLTLPPSTTGESEGSQMGNRVPGPPLHTLLSLHPPHPKSWHAAVEEQASWFLCTFRKRMMGEDLGSARLNPTNCLLAQPSNVLHVRHAL